jgi:glycosyltransferase involved in cell wall biosynthesis
MKIIFFANTDWYLWNFRLNLARSLRARGVDVIMLSPPGNYVEQIQTAGFRWLPLPMSRKGMNPVEELKVLWQVKNIYSKEKPDIAHHFTVKCILYGSIAAHWSRVGAVVNAVTGQGYIFSAPGFGGLILRLIARSLYWHALKGTQIIFQNEEDRRAFIGMHLVDPAAAHLIPGSGIDLERFIPTPEPQGLPVVMFAARMLWEKGVGDFVQAARILRSEGVRARFVLVGDTYKDDPSAVPEQQLKAWKEDGVIEWWGWRDDMQFVLSQSSVVCLPTYYKEGVPRVLTEAAAAGRPIVSSDVVGCKEIVRDGLNGFVVPPKQPVLLAQALRALIDDPHKRAQMGCEGRKIVEQSFSDEKIMLNTFDVYAKLGFADL